MVGVRVGVSVGVELGVSVGVKQSEIGTLLHTPPEQESDVHGLPSSQLTGSEVQLPEEESQKSIVHGLPSSQTMGML